jgi:proteasome lid subunit RPN8/RPN11
MSETTPHPESPIDGAITAAAPPRDVSQIDLADWQSRPLPPVTGGTREARFQVVVRQSVLNLLHRHGQSAPDTEVCGVLVGNVHHDASGPWLYVEHAIEGDHAAGRAAQVTFTAETWAHIQSVMDRDHPDRRILGWYHTHPGFGVFLSDMDVFIQQNFFPEPWQIALVYDPKANEEGLFLWKQGKPAVDGFLLEADTPADHPTTIVAQAKLVPTGGGMNPPGPVAGDLAPFADRLDAIERRQRTILTLLALTGLTAIAWPLAVTAFLPDLMQRRPPPPPINLPSDDPTSRPLKL